MPLNKEQLREKIAIILIQRNIEDFKREFVITDIEKLLSALQAEHEKELNKQGDCLDKKLVDMIKKIESKHDAILEGIAVEIEANKKGVKELFPHINTQNPTEELGNACISKDLYNRGLLDAAALVRAAKGNQE